MSGQGFGVGDFLLSEAEKAALQEASEMLTSVMGRELDVDAVKLAVNTTADPDSTMQARSEYSEEGIKRSLRRLQSRIGKANALKGFHDHGSQVRETVERDYHEGTIQALRDHRTSRVALIITEASELIDEIRNGREFGEVYYSGGPACLAEADDGIPCTHGCEMDEREPFDALVHPRKPEGPLSELADVIIRALDLGYEEHDESSRHGDIDLIDMIFLKLAYNATRPYKHGKKF